MKFGFSTNAYVHYSLEFTLKSISEIGYDGVEIVLDTPHAFLPLNKQKIKTIQSQLKKLNLQVSNLNANTVLGWYKNKLGEKFEPSLSNIDEKLRTWRINYTKNALVLAEELDSPSICVTSGILNTDTKSINYKLFQNSLHDLATFAEKKNVKIAIEYEPGLLIENSEDVFSIISQFKNVGLNFDSCHAAVLGENIISLINKFKNKLFHTHLSDCKNNIHYHLIPGNGDIDFEEIYETLSKICFNGFLTAELYTYSDNPFSAAKQSLSYFKNLVKNH